MRKFAWLLLATSTLYGENAKPQKCVSGDYECWDKKVKAIEKRQKNPSPAWVPSPELSAAIRKPTKSKSVSWRDDLAKFEREYKRDPKALLRKVNRGNPYRIPKVQINCIAIRKRGIFTTREAAICGITVTRR